MDGAEDGDGDGTETGTPAFALRNDGGEVELIPPELSSPIRRKTSEGDQYQYQYPVNCLIENIG